MASEKEVERSERQRADVARLRRDRQFALDNALKELEKLRDAHSSGALTEAVDAFASVRLGFASDADESLVAGEISALVNDMNAKGKNLGADEIRTLTSAVEVLLAARDSFPG
jgi:hypothetical protein